MIQIWETTHLYTIRKFLYDEEIRNYLLPMELHGFPAIDLKKLYDPNLVIYSLRYNYQLAGIAFFKKEADGVVVDEAFFPEFRGKIAKALANSALDLYIEKYNPPKLIGKIRKTNRRALIFATWCKFHVEREDEEFYFVARNCA